MISSGDWFITLGLLALGLAPAAHAGSTKIIDTHCRTEVDTCLNGVAQDYWGATTSYRKRLENFVRGNLRSEIEPLFEACASANPNGLPAAADWWDCAGSNLKTKKNWQKLSGATELVETLAAKRAHLSGSLEACVKNIEKKKSLSAVFASAGLEGLSESQAFTAMEKAYYKNPEGCEAELHSKCLCGFARIARMHWFEEQAALPRWFIETQRDGKKIVTVNPQLLASAPLTRDERLDKCASPEDCFSQIQEIKAPLLKKSRGGLDSAYAKAVELFGDNHPKYAAACAGADTNHQQEFQKNGTFWNCYLDQGRKAAEANPDLKARFHALDKQVQSALADAHTVHLSLSPKTGSFKLRCDEKFGKDACDKFYKERKLDDEVETALARATNFPIDAENLKKRGGKWIVPPIFEKMKECLGDFKGSGAEDANCPLCIDEKTGASKLQPQLNQIKPVASSLKNLALNQVSSGLRMEAVRRTLSGFADLTGTTEIDADWSNQERAEIQGACGQFLYQDKTVWDLIRDFKQNGAASPKSFNEAQGQQMVSAAIVMHRSLVALMRPDLDDNAHYNPLYKRDDTMEAEFKVGGRFGKESRPSHIERFREAAKANISKQLLTHPELSVGMGAPFLDATGAPNADGNSEEFRAWARKRIAESYPMLTQILKNSGVAEQCFTNVGSDTCDSHLKTSEVAAQAKLDDLKKLLEDRNRFLRPASKDFGLALKRLCNENKPEYGGVPLEAFLKDAGSDVFEAAANRDLEENGGNTGFDLLHDCYREYAKSLEKQEFVLKTGIMGGCFALSFASAGLASVGCGALFTTIAAVEWDVAKRDAVHEQQMCRSVGIASATCSPDDIVLAENEVREKWKETRENALWAMGSAATEAKLLINTKRMANVTKQLEQAGYKGLKKLSPNELASLHKFEMAFNAESRARQFTPKELAARRLQALKVVRMYRGINYDSYPLLRSLAFIGYEIYDTTSFFVEKNDEMLKARRDAYLHRDEMRVCQKGGVQKERVVTHLEEIERIDQIIALYERDLRSGKLSAKQIEFVNAKMAEIKGARKELADNVKAMTDCSPEKILGLD